MSHTTAHVSSRAWCSRAGFGEGSPHLTMANVVPVGQDHLVLFECLRHINDMLVRRATEHQVGVFFGLDEGPFNEDIDVGQEAFCRCGIVGRVIDQVIECIERVSGV